MVYLTISMLVVMCNLVESKQKYQFAFNLTDATQSGSQVRDRKLWYAFCESYVYHILRSNVYKAEAKLFNQYTSKVLQLLYLEFKLKYSFLHKSQYEVYNYFDKTQFRGDIPCRYTKSKYVTCKIAYGQFSTSESLYKKYIHINHSLLLKIHKHFYFHVFIQQFHLFKPLDPSNIQDVLEIGPENHQQILPAYIFQGHLAPWEIVFSSNTMIFNIFINNVIISRFKLFLQVVDSILFDKHVACSFVVNVPKNMKCFLFKNLQLSNFRVTDRITRSDTSILIFRIYVIRYQILVLQTNYLTKALKIYDGPTINSKEIRRIKDKYITLDSFQATIVAFQNVAAELIKDALWYSGEAIFTRPVSLKKSDLPLNFKFSTNCFDKCDIVHYKQEFIVNTESHLSITVDQLSYFGPSDYHEMCFYGGFAIYMISEEAYINSSINAIEALRACWNISSLHRELQKGSSPIYKIGTIINTVSIIFVIYGYAQYSLVQSTIRISETKCFSIYVKILPCPADYMAMTFIFNIKKNINSTEMTKVVHHIEYRCSYHFGHQISNNFPLEACVYIVFTHALEAVYSYKNLFDLMEITFAYSYEGFISNNGLFRIWNVESYGTNFSMSSISPLHVKYPTDLFLFESMLNKFQPMFQLSTTNGLLDYCSSSNFDRCNMHYREAKVGNLRFTDPAANKIYSKVARVTSVFPEGDNEDTFFIQLYPLQASLYQSFTSVKIHVIDCHLAEWMSHISNRSLLIHIIDKVCHNQIFNPGSEDVEMYGFTFHQVKTDVIISSNKAAVVSKNMYHMVSPSQRSQSFYFTISLLSDISILPDLVGEMVVKGDLLYHRTDIEHFYTFSANITKCKELYIYFQAPIDELVYVNDSVILITWFFFSFANELKENIDFKIIQNFDRGLQSVDYSEVEKNIPVDFIHRNQLNENVYFKIEEGEIQKSKDFKIWMVHNEVKNPFCPHFMHPSCNDTGFVSWNEADKKCEQINMTLPSVNSDLELEELFRLNFLIDIKDFHLSKSGFYELVGLYIGLNTKVCITLHW